MFELLIIKFLDPNYILISDNIHYEMLKIYFLIDNKINNKTINWSKTIIEQVAEVLEFIGCSIYLEIFELRFLWFE